MRKVTPLTNENGELITVDKVLHQAEVLNKFISSVFAGSQASHISHISERLYGSRGENHSHCKEGASLRPFNEIEV